MYLLLLLEIIYIIVFYRIVNLEYSLEYTILKLLFYFVLKCLTLFENCVILLM